MGTGEIKGMKKAGQQPLVVLLLSAALASGSGAPDYVGFGYGNAACSGNPTWTQYGKELVTPTATHLCRQIVVNGGHHKQDVKATTKCSSDISGDKIMITSFMCKYGSKCSEDCKEWGTTTFTKENFAKMYSGECSVYALQVAGQQSSSIQYSKWFSDSTSAKWHQDVCGAKSKVSTDMAVVQLANTPGCATTSKTPVTVIQDVHVSQTGGCDASNTWNGAGWVMSYTKTVTKCSNNKVVATSDLYNDT